VQGIRIGLPAAGSLLVNGLMIVAIATLGMGRGKAPISRRAAEEPVVLTLAAPRGAEAAAVAPPVPVPPVVSTPVSQLSPAVRPIVPMPVPAVPVVTVASPSVVALARPAELAPAAPAIAPSAPAAAPSVPAGRPEGVAGAERGTSLAYAARVRSWLLAHRLYPRRARMHRDEGVVLVRFVLDRAGTLIEGEILHRSGHDALDEEAVAMLSRASPYPAAPAGLGGNRIELTAPIAFRLPG